MPQGRVRDYCGNISFASETNGVKIVKNRMTVTGSEESF